MTTALVTGGAKGIGRAISAEFAGRGWNVVVTGRDEAAVAATVADITARHQRGAGVLGKRLDVTSLSSVDSVFTEISRELGPLSILVNCAGVIARGPAEDLSDEDWRRVIETDVTGVFRCCKAAFTDLARSDDAAIVNVGSVAAGVGISGRVAYTSSKAAVEGLTRTLALEWAQYGVRVNTVAPGWTLTEMVVSGIASGHLSEQALTARIPQRRLADPSEIARVVAFLASPASSYVNGASWPVDGGMLQMGPQAGSHITSNDWREN